MGVWTPIGGVNGFSAVFDGKGHTIKNVKVRSSETSSALGAGLFGVLSETAVVKNLGVVDAQVFAHQEVFAGGVGGVFEWTNL
ncbi:MAG: hypothetical protein LBP35_01520 [Candidatus Ancillula trichonymphae]|nr:hypothetical protein [Candidatus Ancillula trichonymphae]